MPSTDNFEFDLVSDFSGYNSARDKTNVSKAVLVRGSKNVYKKLLGTIASRDGLKKRGLANTAISGIKSAFVFNSSVGLVRPLRVVDQTSSGADAKLQVESDILSPGNYVWYDLLTGLSLTRFVFDKWYDNTEKKDRTIFVKGDTTLNTWSGGIAVLSSASNTDIAIVGNNTLLTSQAVSKSGATINVASNSLAGLLAEISINLTGQPANGDAIQLTLNGTGIIFTFVTTIGVAAGNVLIDSTSALTLANLLDLLQHPSSTNAKHVALSGGNQTLVGYLTATSAFSITNTGTKTFAQLGFATNLLSEKKLLINGNPYSYTTGENSNTLGGVTPDPTGEPANSVILQAVVVQAVLPAAGFSNDFLKVIGNRVHIGSYTSRLIYISDSLDFTNYIVPTPRTPGTPELLTLDNAAVGISVRDGNAHISAGDSDWYEVSYTSITVSTTLTEETKVDKKPTSVQGAAYAHEFIDTCGNDIIYLSQDQQVRVFGTFRNLAQAKYPSLSQQVQTEFVAENFIGGHLRCIGDFIYVTAPVNGRDWMHQTRETVDKAGNVVAERLWHPPQIRNISRFVVISGTLYGHSNANPMIYQIWNTLQWSDDGPSGDPLPYTCVMKLSYRHLGGKSGDRRQGMLQFDKVYVEGYMANGSLLYGNIYMDYQGAKGVQGITINTINRPATFFYGNNPPSLGTDDLGDNPLGDGLTPDTNEQELLNKYRVIRKVNPVNVFEYDIEIYSSDLYSRWEVLAVGVNPVLADQEPTFLCK